MTAAVVRTTALEHIVKKLEHIGIGPDHVGNQRTGKKCRVQTLYDT
jgi:hypothetical protein